MSEARVSDSGLFNAKAVTKLYDKCQSQPVSGFRDNAAFVGVLSTQLWLQTFTGTSVRAAEAA